MVRNPKALGLSLIAAFAIAASAAPAASAELFGFTSEAEDTVLTGAENEGATETTGGTVACETTVFEGTLAGELSRQFSLALSHEGCVAFGFAAAVVDMNSCEYVLTAGTKQGSSYEAEAGIECAEAGDSITVTAKLFGTTKCTVRYGEQGALAQVTVTEEGSPSAILAHLALSGLEYTETGGTGFGACSSSAGQANGTYTSTVLLEGFVGETQVNVGQKVPPQGLITPDPEAIDFKGKVGKPQSFDITNTSKGQVEIISLTVPPPLGKWFALAGKCVATPAAVLKKPGDKCTEEVTCVQAMGKKAILSGLSNPQSFLAVKLENC